MVRIRILALPGYDYADGLSVAPVFKSLERRAKIISLDVLSIKDQSNHTTTYPQVTRFTDEDMMLIKNTIQRVRAYPNDETKKFAIQLADESAKLIGLTETPPKRMEFLQTLLQDYVVLTR